MLSPMRFGRNETTVNIRREKIVIEVIVIFFLFYTIIIKNSKKMQLSLIGKKSQMSNELR